MKTNVNHSPWQQNASPAKVLFIRLQAMGDMAITLPYIRGFKTEYQSAELDFLTRKEVDSIPKNSGIFNKVYSIKGGRNQKLQFLFLMKLLPDLLLAGYDMVVDLQNNSVSKAVRKLLMPKAWAEFDKYSPIPAGERTLATIEAAVGGKIVPEFSFQNIVRGPAQLLKKAGWREENQLVAINPAGFLVTRNWPLEHYAEFCRLWLEKFPNTQFVILGTSSISEKANFLKKTFKESFINLVGDTTPYEAICILQMVTIIITEDSGLMHMAWTTGIPTLALFGSSRQDWSRPLGHHTLCLDSSDLECGCCMQPECKYGDVRCLTRYSPDLVFKLAINLLNEQSRA